jgi:circadian clock protein KaiC
LISSSTEKEVHTILLRQIDSMKSTGNTAAIVSHTGGGDSLEGTNVGISSLTDTWILLRDVELNGERNRCLYVLKSRGMAHSNQLREFVLTSDGIQLVPAYIGAGGVLTGSSRVAQEAKEKADALLRQQEAQANQLRIDRRRLALQAQLESLKVDLADVEREAAETGLEEQQREAELKLDRERMAESRGSK